MAVPLHRTQILLEPEQHRILTEAASQEERSMSDLVRQIIQDWIEARQGEIRLQQELQALEELNQTRLKVQEEHGVYKGNLLDGEHNGQEIQEQPGVYSSRQRIDREAILHTLSELPAESLIALAEFIDFLQAKARSERQPRQTVRLGGIWQGHTFSEQEISAARRETWKKLGNSLDG